MYNLDILTHSCLIFYSLKLANLSRLWTFIHIIINLVQYRLIRCEWENVHSSTAILTIVILTTMICLLSFPLLGKVRLGYRLAINSVKMEFRQSGNSVKIEIRWTGNLVKMEIQQTRNLMIPCQFVSWRTLRLLSFCLRWLANYVDSPMSICWNSGMLNLHFYQISGLSNLCFTEFPVHRISIFTKFIASLAELCRQNDSNQIDID